jgi:hypothetical protein
MSDDITTLPFSDSGKGKDSYEFKELVACLWRNFLPNGRQVWPRYCLPGMKTEVILPPKIHYVVYGEYPATKLVSVAKGIYIVNFDVPCVLVPLRAVNCSPSEKPVHYPVIVNTDGDVYDDALRAVFETYKMESEKACQDDLRRYVWGIEAEGDPDRVAIRIRHFLTNCSYQKRHNQFINGNIGFLYSLPRPVLYAIWQALKFGLRARTLDMPLESLTVGV